MQPNKAQEKQNEQIIGQYYKINENRDEECGYGYL